jgi:hypothetical protein
MTSNNNKLVKRGHPDSITPVKEEKLESILKVGGTIAEACSYAGIPERTYYSRAERDEQFMQKMESAKYYADVVAKKVVVRKIIKDKDLETAKWWLDRRSFRQNNNTNIQVNNIIATKKQEYDI